MQGSHHRKENFYLANISTSTTNLLQGQCYNEIKKQRLTELDGVERENILLSKPIRWVHRSEEFACETHLTNFNLDFSIGTW